MISNTRRADAALQGRATMAHAEATNEAEAVLRCVAT
jgi:hypothetical protein